MIFIIYLVSDVVFYLESLNEEESHATFAVAAKLLTGMQNDKNLSLSMIRQCPKLLMAVYTHL